MRAYGLTVMIGGAACMVAGSVTATNAQEAARQRAPIVRVYSSGAVDVIGTPTYITPEIRLSENAYLFAVALDLDGNLRVLYPELPGISVKVSAHTQLRLPNFFVGFNRQNGTVHDGYYANGHYTSGYDGYVDDTRGTVVRWRHGFRSTSTSFRGAVTGISAPSGSSWSTARHRMRRWSSADI